MIPYILFSGVFCINIILSFYLNNLMLGETMFV